MATTKAQVGIFEIRWNWLVAICVMLTISGMIRLGIWQLDRAAEKISLQQSYAESGLQEATPINEIPVAGIEFDLIQHQNRNVALQGHYINDQSIFLIYQAYEDQIGYEIVTPFKPDGMDSIVLVSRGCSASSTYEALLANTPQITGQHKLLGQIYVPTIKEASKTGTIKELKWPLLIRYLNTAELAPHFSLPLFPYVVRLATGQPGTLIRHWPTVSAETGRNFSYALQWFAMAIAVSIVSLVLSSNFLKIISGNKAN